MPPEEFQSLESSLDNCAHELLSELDDDELWTKYIAFQFSLQVKICQQYPEFDWDNFG